MYDTYNILYHVDGKTGYPHVSTIPLVVQEVNPNHLLAEPRFAVCSVRRLPDKARNRRARPGRSLNVEWRVKWHWKCYVKIQEIEIIWFQPLLKHGL